MINLLNIIVRNALAMTFDDTLSPAETLAAVVSKVNEMVTALNAILGTDLTAEIDAKLEEWETDGTLADIIAAYIAGMVDTELTDAHTSTVKSKVFSDIDERFEELEQDTRNLYVDVTLFGAVGDGTTDDTAAIQAAINFCLLNHCDLSVSKLCKITEPLLIDREVDNTDYDSYFTIFSNSGGGFYAASAFAMFSSSLTYTTAPVTQLVRWQNLRFVASIANMAAYVLDRSIFLRSVFVGCSFSKIKCLESSTYTQSLSLINCNARRQVGTFFKAPLNYDLQVIGGLYESITGDGFDIKSPIGCKIDTMMEGVSGTALLINGAQGIDIRGFFEANGKDIDSRTGGEISRGITIHGSYFSHAAADYSVLWGACVGCRSVGNWHTYNFHDLQADSIVEINDIAQGNLSDAGIAVSHGGYLENADFTLVVRSDVSAAYTVSDLVTKLTMIGNRVNIEFICTMTSTDTNAESMIYIPSLFPADADPDCINMLCGMVQVAGSTLDNAGISPLYIADDSPLRIQSCVNVIPANTATDSWTVRGQISYQALKVEMPD